MRAAVLEGTDFEIFDGASPPLRYEHIPLSYAEVEEIEDEVDENKEVEGSVEKPHITGEPIEPQETVFREKNSRAHFARKRYCWRTRRLLGVWTS